MTDRQIDLPLFQPEEPEGQPPGGAGGGSGAGTLKRLIDENFLQYASYVIRDRAIPDLEDGLKPVQRRILFSLHENDDGKFIKVANVVGYCMQFHPHGDASIAEALVALANRQYLIERQGNYGNILTGDPPAASRYIECRLTDLARSELFNDELTEFVPSYDGRKKEPVTLPAKIPLLLMHGAEGIAVGVATRVLPHNLAELLESQIAILSNKPFRILPDFPQGGLMDGVAYEDGRGHVLVRARIEKKDPRTLVIRELPYGATTDSLMTSIEEASRRGKIRIRSLNDFTAGQVEIEIQLPPEQDPDRAIEALYAFTQCQTQIASRIVVIRDSKPVEMTVTKILRHNTSRLVATLRRELELKRRKLADQIHQLMLVRVFVENRIYRQIESTDSTASMIQAVLDGMQPFCSRFQRDITRNDAETLLAIPIRRISRYDLDKNRTEMERLREGVNEAEENLAALVPFAIRYLRNLLRTHGAQFPRRTRTTEFRSVSERDLTAHELTIAYNEEKGYIGHKVPGTHLLSCSPLDRLLLVWNDGKCKLVAPPEKLFVDTSLIYCGILDRDRVMTAVFESDFFTHVKRFVAGGLVTGRESRLAPKGARIRFFSVDNPAALYVRYAGNGRTKIRQQVFNLNRLPVLKRNAGGQVMTANKIEFVGAEKPSDWDDSLTGPPGRFSSFA
jgi:topoisomerase-4 subunit A